MRAGTRNFVSRKGRRVLPFLLLVLIAVLGCDMFSPAPAQERQGTAMAMVFRRPLAQDPETLDPARIWDIYSRSVSQQIFDGLVQFDQTLTIKPALAALWRSSRDGLVWTFELRKDVKFHHGREVTADDVVYSFTRILDSKTRSGAAELFLNVAGAREFREGRAKTVSGLVALDRHTLQVTLVEALVPFAAVAAVGHAKVVPRDLVEAQGETFGLRPVGTGPFRFLRWEHGKEIVLTANGDYFDGSPKLSRLVYRVFPGDQRDAMHAEFMKGNLEDAPVPAGADRRQLAVSTSHIYVKRPMISVRFYGFNLRTFPFNDRRVRQAIVHAIDREGIVQNHFGQYTFARGILPPGMLGFNRKLTGFSYDPQKARALLADAGYSGGRGIPPLVIWSSVKRPEILREHDEIKKSLAAVGLSVEARYHTNWSAFSKTVEEGQVAFFLWAWYADVPDPENFLAKLFYSSSPRNVFGYANPAVDTLLIGARKVSDLSQRVELYRRAEELILEDAPVMPMFHHTYERLFQPYVRSVEVNGLGDPYIPFRRIWLDPAR